MYHDEDYRYPRTLKEAFGEDAKLTKVERRGRALGVVVTLVVVIVTISLAVACNAPK